MKVVLDKTFVSKCRFDAVPVVDDAGRVTSTEQNTKGRFYDVRDAHPDAPTGFALRVNKTSKTYILLMRQGAKVVTVTVGRHPDLLIGKDVPADRNARLLAAELSVRIRRGENVNDARKEERIVERASKRTLRDLFQDWLEDYQSSAKRDPRKNTIDAVSKAMDRLGHLMERSAGEITWRDLEEFFTDKATAQGHLTAAEQTIRWVSTVYNLANRRLTLDALQVRVQPALYVNPAAIFLQTGKVRDGSELQRDYDKKGIRKPLSGTREHFTKWLDYVLKARHDGSSRTGADYMLLTVILGLRRNESAGLLWNDRVGMVPAPTHPAAGVNFIDLQNGLLALNVTKNRYAHRLPLPNFILKMLKERRGLVGDSPYVFPRVSRSRLARSPHYNDPRSFMEEVKKCIQVSFAMHDLRRTFGNVVTSIGFPDRLAKQLLNHKTAGSTARYTDQSIEQLRSVMQKVEDEMLSYATGKQDFGTSKNPNLS